jgi:hypothetical protein
VLILFVILYQLSNSEVSDYLMQRRFLRQHDKHEHSYSSHSQNREVETVNILTRLPGNEGSCGKHNKECYSSSAAITMLNREQSAEVSDTSKAT